MITSKINKITLFYFLRMQLQRWDLNQNFLSACWKQQRALLYLWILHVYLYIFTSSNFARMHKNTLSVNCYSNVRRHSKFCIKPESFVLPRTLQKFKHRWNSKIARLRMVLYKSNDRRRLPERRKQMEKGWNDGDSIRRDRHTRGSGWYSSRVPSEKRRREDVARGKAVQYPVICNSAVSRWKSIDSFPANHSTANAR